MSFNRNKPYFQQSGTSKTNIHWELPDYPTFLKWLAEWERQCDSKRYDIYLAGNIAEQIFGNSILPTKDVDICIVGKIKDPHHQAVVT